jgi:hypothetical protein
LPVLENKLLKKDKQTKATEKDMRRLFKGKKKREDI